MTRRDFVLIARVIKDVNARKAKGVRIAELFADELEQVNPSFDRERFIKAATEPVPCINPNAGADNEYCPCLRHDGGK